MAVPSGMTTLNMSGKYTQNKKLSDSMERILSLQGASFVVRKAISMGSVHITIAHSVKGGVEKLVMNQTLPGGVGASTEERVLDRTERIVDHAARGKTSTKSKRIALNELEEAFLKEGWAGEADKHGVVNIQTVSTEKNWSSNATWGLEEVSGALRHVRRIAFTGPKGEKVQVRLVFDYVGDA